jgi:hypothetical protein
VKLLPKHKVILQISLLSKNFAIPSIVMVLVVRIKCVIFVYQSTKTKIKIKDLEHGRIRMKWDDHGLSRIESNYIKPYGQLMANDVVLYTFMAIKISLI